MSQRILLICGSLESGADGLGDYSRRLAAGLCRQGADASCLSLHDSGVRAWYEGREVEPGVGEILVRRIPASWSTTNRTRALDDLLRELKPDVCSLQLVNYAYHPKGFMGRFNRHQAPLLARYPVHLMWHELWLGLVAGASLKHRLVGRWQAQTIRATVRRLQPRWQHTSIPFYQTLLRRSGIEVGLLPLFGNFALGEEPGYNLLSRLRVGHGSRVGDEEAIRFVVFGTIPAEFPFERWVADAHKLHRRSRRRIVLISIGRVGSGARIWEDWKRRVAPLDWIALAALGPLQPAQIRSVFDQVAAGLSLNAMEGWGKSGAVAAMLESGLTVCGYERGIAPAALKWSTPTEGGIWLLDSQKPDPWPDAFSRRSKEDRLERVARQLYSELRR